MEERTRLGTWVLCAAFVVGALGDALLRGTPWGVNFPLWVLALVALASVPVLFGWTAFGRGTRLLAALALLFSFALAWRASPALAVLNVLASLIALALAAARAGERGFLPGSIEKQALDLFKTGAFSFAGPVPFAAREIRWEEAGGWRGPALAGVRGVLISVPLLFVFGGLLVAADAIFENLIFSVFSFDVGLVFGHAALILFLFWISAGALYLAFFKEDFPEIPAGGRPGWLGLGALETGMALGSLNTLFLAFVVVQSRYLFGSAANSGMDLSEYARRGFFELVAVAALVVPLLLGLHWLLDARSRRQRLTFDVLALVMVFLVFVILASALWRMSLYYDEYGLTELRLYTTAFMAWIGFVLLLFSPTVLCGRRDLFGSLTLFSGFAAIALLNLANPDATIARANLQRLEEGKRFDSVYLTYLSEDAAPVILQNETAADRPLYRDTPVTPSGRERTLAGPTLREELLGRWRTGDRDWRSWNFSRSTAQALASR